MKKAIYKGKKLAESDETVLVEGNHYFPPESINNAFFTHSDRHTTCPWKGKASYYNIKVGDAEILNGAWYYPEPSQAAAKIKDHVAFGSEVMVTE